MCNVYYIYMGHMACLLSIWHVACYQPEDFGFSFPIEIPVPRVGKGQNATRGQFPYQVSLMRPTRKDSYDILTTEFSTFCGGAIIHRVKVLTAAQCIVPDATYCEKIFAYKPTIVEPKDIIAVAGILKPKEYLNRDNYTQWRKVQKGYGYPGFKYPYRNIAILVVDIPYEFNEFVDELPVASVVKDYSSIHKCVIAGFGTSRGSSEYLLWAYINVLNFKECAARFKDKMDTSHFICSDDKYQEFFKEDSGGALVCFNTTDPADHDGKGVIVGVIGGEVKCKKLKCGTVYTRVTSYKRMFNVAVKNTRITYYYSFLIIFYFYQNLISVLIKLW